jgi:CRP-like cAMP-binding protein
LVQRGEVLVIKAGVPIIRLGPREPGGEMAILCGEDHTRSATVKAVTRTRCLVMARQAFRRCLELNPALGKGLIRVLIGRLRRDTVA